MAWIAHVQGSNAIIDQCASQKEETVAEKLFQRQLKFVTVSLLSLGLIDQPFPLEQLKVANIGQTSYVMPWGGARLPLSTTC